MTIDEMQNLTPDESLGLVLELFGPRRTVETDELNVELWSQI